jgi:hypothetical protein
LRGDDVDPQRAGRRQPEPVAAGPIVAAETDTHVTVNLVVDKADLARHRQFLETLLAMMPAK